MSNRSLIVEEIFNNFDHHSPAACTFSKSAPSPQAASLVDVGVFRSVCGTQWCVAGLQADPGSSRPQSLLRCTDPFPSDCQELPEFFLVSLARSCCQSFPGEPRRWFDTLSASVSPETRHIVSVGRRDRILLSSDASISCLLELGRQVRLIRLSMQMS